MPASLDVRIARQQAITRQLLELPANAQALQDMLDWFAGVHHAKAGDEHMKRLPEWAEQTARLGVLTLDEHRSAVSGAFVAALHKEYQDIDNLDKVLAVDMREVQQHLSGLGLKVAQTAVNMAPPESNLSISHERQVEWLWMAWAVSRKKSIMSRLTELAGRTDEVGRAVVMIFQDNVQLPEIYEALALTRRKLAPATSPLMHAHSDMRDVSELAAELRRDRAWSRHVWLVEFKNNQYYVVTKSGTMPPNCPQQWQGRPVSARGPSPREQRDYQQMCDIGNEP